ncbi:MAG: hypothetical protein SFU91_08625 [Chloroherpetonaceae bacterium]|nr:hypothetical protein [Chloroherpetonaceae bacterium]
MTFNRKILSLGIASYLIFLLVSGCGTFTVLSHPEVEVLDPDTKKFYFEEVTFASNCSSCHEGTPDKFGIYSKLALKEPLLATGQGKTSYEKIISEINQNAELANSGAEFDAFSIYANSPFLSFYLIPWWYQSDNIQSSLFSGQLNEEVIENRTKDTRRQSFRRILGRLRLENETYMNFQNGAGIRANGTLVQMQGQGISPSMVVQWPSLFPDSTAVSPSSNTIAPSASSPLGGDISTTRRTAPVTPIETPPQTSPPPEASPNPISTPVTPPPAATQPPSTPTPAPPAQPARGSEKKEENSTGRASGRKRN